MEITIAHLYYDLLNLYGESGNTKALKSYLEKQGVSVNLKKVTIHEEFDFSQCDFIYIGSGTEVNLKIALKDLMKYKEQIKNYLDSGKFLLATGNSLELFGQYIIDALQKKHKALNLFSYYCIETDKRTVCESVVACSFLKDKIIGFQNRCSITKNIKDFLFDVEVGCGSEEKFFKEGILYKNFFGTYLIGPILVRNPHFLKHIGDNLILNKDEEYLLKQISLDFEAKAYQINLKKYLEKVSR